MSGTTPPSGLPGGANDQSMEDILASIRRILNEDEQVAPQAAGAPAGGDAAQSARDAVPPQGDAAPMATGASTAPPVPGPDEPLLLTEDMMVPADPTAPPGPAPEGAAPAEEVSAAVPPAALPPAETLIAPAVAAATAASVGRLLSAVSAERGTAISRGGPTIEDVVREELRPLLKDWLDQHLPGLVERLVRAEIERVVGRALG